MYQIILKNNDELFQNSQIKGTFVILEALTVRGTVVKHKTGVLCPCVIQPEGGANVDCQALQSNAIFIDIKIYKNRIEYFLLFFKQALYSLQVSKTVFLSVK